MGASAGRGPNWGLGSPPAPFRSGVSHTAGPCRRRDSCSGRCWHTLRHFGSAGARCHTPGLWWEQSEDRREQWDQTCDERVWMTLYLKWTVMHQKHSIKNAYYKILEKIISYYYLLTCPIRIRWNLDYPGGKTRKAPHALIWTNQKLTKSFLQVKRCHILLLFELFILGNMLIGVGVSCRTLVLAGTSILLDSPLVAKKLSQIGT